jgi:uncharacterized membrane protein
MMEIPLDAEVECRERACGRSTYVIINPVNQEVTHLVVEEKRSPHTERLVSIDQVGSTTRDSVRLRCTRDELAKLDPFVSTEFVWSERRHYIDGPYGMWPYVVPETIRVPVKHRRVPPGELAVRRGAHVRATDGDVGRVGEFLVDPTNGRIRHLVLREGHPWGRRDVTIPISQIDQVLEGTVYLKLDKRTVKSLFPVPVRRRYIWDRPSTTDWELILLTFAEEGTADKAVDAFKRLDKQWGMRASAAVLSKDQDGETSLKETEDVDSKHGALFGAIAGGLIGMLAGTPGAMVGAAAGALTGGVTAHEMDMGFSDRFLEELQGGLRPGSSALLVLVEHRWVDRVLHALARFKGREFWHPLTDEITAQLIAVMAEGS